MLQLVKQVTAELGIQDTVAGDELLFDIITQVWQHDQDCCSDLPLGRTVHVQHP